MKLYFEKNISKNLTESKKRMNESVRGIEILNSYMKDIINKVIPNVPSFSVMQDGSRGYLISTKNISIDDINTIADRLDKQFSPESISVIDTEIRIKFSKQSRM